jgi:hypothetical protein
MTDHQPLTEQQLDSYAELAITADHDGLKVDPAVVTVLVDEVRRLRFQRQYLLRQIAKRDAESGRGEEALREFLAAEQPADPREPFRFVDDDGDYLHIGIPASPANGGPAVSFHTVTEPVHLPVDRIDEVIATLRRLKAAQQ